MTEENPYASQTRANTNVDWSGRFTDLEDDANGDVDIDLEGIAEYAQMMMTIQRNLMDGMGDVSDLGSLPGKAWEGVVLPEGRMAMMRLSENYSEFQAYLQHLGTALMNIGMAAQTVADAYANSDGWSAASLNAVDYAFGISGAERPAGLPPWVDGKTYFDLLRENQGGTPPPGSALWRDGGEESTSPYTSTRTAYGPNGERMVVTTSSPPGGGTTYITTTIYGRDGQQISQSSQTVSYYRDGNTNVQVTRNSDGTETERRTTYGDNGQQTGESTVNRDANGNETRSTTTETNDDGSQTITERSGDETTETEVGPQTEGETGVPDDPAMDAIDNIQDGQYSS